MPVSKPDQLPADGPLRQTLLPICEQGDGQQLAEDDTALDSEWADTMEDDIEEARKIASEESLYASLSARKNNYRRPPSPAFSCVLQVKGTVLAIQQPDVGIMQARPLSGGG